MPAGVYQDPAVSEPRPVLDLCSIDEELPLLTEVDELTEGLQPPQEAPNGVGRDGGPARLVRCVDLHLVWREILGRNYKRVLAYIVRSCPCRELSRTQSAWSALFPQSGAPRGTAHPLSHQPGPGVYLEECWQRPGGKFSWDIWQWLRPGYHRSHGEILKLPVHIFLV